MKERKLLETAPAIPVVEYKYKSDNSTHPFRVRLDPERLGDLLKSDFALQDDQIRRSKFTVTDEVVMTGITLNISPKGAFVSESHAIGTTDSGRDKDGRRNIIINLGSILLQSDDLKSNALIYCVLAKRQNLPPTLESHRRQTEAVLSIGFRTKRMQSYLKQVDWQRANQFLDRLLSKKITDKVSKVLVHESSHLKDLDELEEARADFRKGGKRGILALGGSVAGSVGYIGMLIVDVPFAYALIPLGFSAVSVSAAGILTSRLKRYVDWQTNLVKSTEERARNTTEKANISKWEEVIQLEPNQNYALQV